MKLVNHYRYLVALLLTGLAAPPATVHAEQDKPQTVGATPPVLAAAAPPFCVYPIHANRPEMAEMGVLAIDEIENNDTTNTAQSLPLGPNFGQSMSIDVTANLSSNGDVDYFSFTANKGDVIGIAAQGGPIPDMTLAITDAGGGEIIENFDHQFQSYAFPPNSPLPGGVDAADAALSWIVPAAGTYFIRAQSDLLATSGSYTLLIRGSRPGVASQPSPGTQIVWLDFDGATIHPYELFGAGYNTTTLSPLSAYLENWGLEASDEDAVIDAILAGVQENYDDLRLASLNGNRPTDSVAGHMHIEFRNSRDDGDLWGQPNVARVIVGGGMFQLGIQVIGIAQYIDVGNFSTEDTAVVLLDILSAPPDYTDSINAIVLDPSVTIIDAIGVVVGYTVSHEVGHYLGNWHTKNDNTLLNVMDKGGDDGGADRRSGVGPDGIFGTDDDIDVDFVIDDFDSQEEISFGLERTTIRTAFGLSTGAGTLYVDVDNDSGDEIGSFALPYNTVTEGHDIVTPGGTVILMNGDYPEIVTLSRPAVFNAQGGTATIGTPPPPLPKTASGIDGEAGRP